MSSTKITEACLAERGVKLKCKTSSSWMRAVGFFVPVFITQFWTTIGDTIFYPSALANEPTEKIIADFAIVIRHELVHVTQRGWMPTWFWLLCYLFFPVPIFFAWFRWKMEREAYLVQVRPENFETPQQLILYLDRVVEDLWKYYGWVWPKPWMRSWFVKKLNLTEEMFDAK